jgi:phosphoribosyl 1,2-cyclic phosphodiesterase/CheY-like chemotaxis protein
LKTRALRVYVVEDNAVQAEIARALLEKAGHVVIVNQSSEDALQDIPCQRPDCVVIDIMLPGIDGYELCRQLRARDDLAATKLVMMSTKAFPFERKRAAELGADAYFVKPLHPATFAPQLERVVAGTLAMTFWGVRGTLPVCRPDSHRYGGNTLCVSLTFPDDRLVVFDAGTGIKALSDALVAARRTRIEGTIFISHPHWDHINTLPFFAPFYTAGNHFQICGPSHGGVTMRDLITAQMDGVYFPITVREFAASLDYRDLGEGSFDVGGTRLRTLLLNHPGNCLGYRIQHGDRAICYVTDNELYPPTSEFYSEEYVERLVDFVREADHLITDCTYLDEEYPRKIRWGHSPVSRVADLAARARVKTLYLVHHDPDHTDAVIDAKLARCQERLAAAGARTRVLAPADGAEFDV